VEVNDARPYRNARTKDRRRRRGTYRTPIIGGRIVTRRHTARREPARD
jgi:hypothetical protein